MPSGASPWRGPFVALCCLFALLALPVPAAAVEIRGANHLWLDDTTVLVRLDIDMRLPAVLEAALANGVTLEFEAETRLERGRRVGRDTLASETRRVQLQYFALNRHYLVTAVTDERMDLKPTLGDALDQVARRLGRLRLDGIPASARPNPGEFDLAARLMLVYSALPLPLQLDAGLRGDLTTRQEWRRWSLD
ncbi:MULTISPECIES: DUF4390 domain-containing protein [Thioalkalivibrio]|uniref:DUF4390 domain-containing protein n=1 Tax=Thioalkalivibrio TaxID=106633 RepID=UPI0003609A4E|nr:MULTISPECIES: DUF4390 domain-containing protein [Thioalkalivibrio]OOC48585.1 hypothetical protein B0684_08815 [Thioalkalivibrio versutus]